MGTTFLPTNAILTKGCFKIKLYCVCTFKYGELLAEHIKKISNHFLNVCYTVLRSSQYNTEELLLTLTLLIL